MNRPWLWIVIALCVYGAWNAWTRREQAQSPGVLVPEVPVQTALDRSAAPFEHDGYSIRPLANFRLRARVLSREDYHFDEMAGLIPTDLALGWGRMSDSDMLKNFEISQSGRFFHWRVNAFPMPQDEIVSHAANMHMIPANDSVQVALKQVRAGQIIALRGELVEVKRPDGWTLRSSLTRDDSGAGACEVIWVEDLQLR